MGYDQAASGAEGGVLALQQTLVEQVCCQTRRAELVPHEEGNLHSATIVMMHRLHVKPNRTNLLATPHPVYFWMRWTQPGSMDRVNSHGGNHIISR